MPYADLGRPLARKSELSKGILNNRISEHILSNLSQIGIKNHLVKRLNMREQLIKSCEIIPLEVVVRNLAAGSMSKRLGLAEGTILPRPIVEFYYKKDELSDPLVTEEHIISFNWATRIELEEIVSIASTVTKIENVVFSYNNRTGNIVGLSTQPHGLLEGDIVSVSGLSTDTLRSLDGQHRIGFSTETFTLNVGLGTTGVTGIVTSIDVAGNFSPRNINANDVLGLSLIHI